MQLKAISLHRPPRPGANDRGRRAGGEGGPGSAPRPRGHGHGGALSFSSQCPVGKTGAAAPPFPGAVRSNLLSLQVSARGEINTPDAACPRGTAARESRRPPRSPPPAHSRLASQSAPREERATPSGRRRGHAAPRAGLRHITSAPPASSPLVGVVGLSLTLTSRRRRARGVTSGSAPAPGAGLPPCRARGRCLGLSGGPLAPPSGLGHVPGPAPPPDLKCSVSPSATRKV